MEELLNPDNRTDETAPVIEVTEEILQAYRYEALRPGDRFGQLTVIQKAPGKIYYTPGGDRRVFRKWLCKCDCGNETVVLENSLKTGLTKSCGCLRGRKEENPIEPGDRFGMLTAIRELDDYKWLCRCDCGKEKEVYAYSLKNGSTQSCGCMRAQNSEVTINPGDRFGMLTVIDEAPSRTTTFENGRKSTVRYWLCLCDCGKEKEIADSSLRYGRTESCGCRKRQLRPPVNPGDRYGMLTVVEKAADREYIMPNGKKQIHHYWICLCDCGKTTEVKEQNLKSGTSKSCGCTRKKTAPPAADT